MPNPQFRKRLINEIRHAVQEYHDAADEGHPGLRGRAREIAVGRLFAPLLPVTIGIGTGKVVDARGESSSETDIVVYSKTLLPSLLYDASQGLFPIEAALLTIEVKSKLTSRELRDTLNKGRKLQKKLTYTSGIHDLASGTPIKHDLIPVYRILFAFDSDLAGKRESEFERYERYENAAIGKRSIDAMCVVGRGTWSYSFINSIKWGFQPATKEYDEVISLLYSVCNSIPIISASRGQPMFGYYVYNDQQMVRGT